MSCKGCIERHLGCHSECESYLEFKKLKSIEQENRLKQRERGTGTIRTRQSFYKNGRGQR